MNRDQLANFCSARSATNEPYKQFSACAARLWLPTIDVEIDRALKDRIRVRGKASKGSTAKATLTSDELTLIDDIVAHLHDEQVQEIASELAVEHHNLKMTSTTHKPTIGAHLATGKLPTTTVITLDESLSQNVQELPTTSEQTSSAATASVIAESRVIKVTTSASTTTQPPSPAPVSIVHDGPASGSLVVLSHNSSSTTSSIRERVVTANSPEHGSSLSSLLTTTSAPQVLLEPVKVQIPEPISPTPPLHSPQSSVLVGGQTEVAVQTNHGTAAPMAQTPVNQEPALVVQPAASTHQTASASVVQPVHSTVDASTSTQTTVLHPEANLVPTDISPAQASSAVVIPSPVANVVSPVEPPKLQAASVSTAHAESSAPAGSVASASAIAPLAAPAPIESQNGSLISGGKQVSVSTSSSSTTSSGTTASASAATINLPPQTQAGGSPSGLPIQAMLSPENGPLSLAANAAAIASSVSAGIASLAPVTSAPTLTNYSDHLPTTNSPPQSSIPAPPLASAHASSMSSSEPTSLPVHSIVLPPVAAAPILPVTPVALVPNPAPPLTGLALNHAAPLPTPLVQSVPVKAIPNLAEPVQFHSANQASSPMPISAPMKTHIPLLGETIVSTQTSSSIKITGASTTTARPQVTVSIVDTATQTKTVRVDQLTTDGGKMSATKEPASLRQTLRVTPLLALSSKKPALVIQKALTKPPAITLDKNVKHELLDLKAKYGQNADVHDVIVVGEHSEGDDLVLDYDDHSEHHGEHGQDSGDGHHGHHENEELKIEHVAHKEVSRKKTLLVTEKNSGDLDEDSFVKTIANKRNNLKGKKKAALAVSSGNSETSDDDHNDHEHLLDGLTAGDVIHVDAGETD